MSEKLSQDIREAINRGFNNSFRPVNLNGIHKDVHMLNCIYEEVAKLVENIEQVQRPLFIYDYQVAPVSSEEVIIALRRLRFSSSQVEISEPVMEYIVRESISPIMADGPEETKQQTWRDRKPLF